MWVLQQNYNMAFSLSFFFSLLLLLCESLKVGIDISLLRFMYNGNMLMLKWQKLSVWTDGDPNLFWLSKCLTTLRFFLCDYDKDLWKLIFCFSGSPRQIINYYFLLKCWENFAIQLQLYVSKLIRFHREKVNSVLEIPRQRVVNAVMCGTFFWMNRAVKQWWNPFYFLVI